MNLRWLVFDYVDPALELSAEQRQRVRLRGLFNPPMIGDPGFRPPKSARVSWLALLVATLTPAAGMMLGFGAFFLFFKGSNLWGIPVMFAVQIISTWLLLALVGKYTWKPLVCAELREMGYDVCPRCGYWLRGLNDDVQQCPECGEARLQEEAT